jgi:putative heme iron utilization protein
LRRFYSGVLGTRGVRYPDYPYTAALPFCTDQQGRLIIFISHLSEHTKAIEHNPHVSFTASPMVPQLRPEARATMLGKIGANDSPTSAARYLRFFPDNRRFIDIGGFSFYTIEPHHVRLIAGFGSAHWLNGGNVLAARLPIADAEEDIIEHMNDDHHDSLIAYCRHVHGVEATSVQMVGIDCDGFDVRADEILLRFEFETAIASASDARAVLVSLAQAARS